MDNLNIHHRTAQIEYFTSTTEHRPQHRNTHLLHDFEAGRLGVIDFLKAVRDAKTPTNTTPEQPNPPQHNYVPAHNNIF